MAVGGWAGMALGWLSGNNFRTSLVPKAYYFLYSVGSVFLLPFVNVFYRQCGFSEELIGVLCALKPWVAAPAGTLIVSVADATQRHLAILLAVYLIAFLGRSLMAFFVGLAAQLVIALLTEAAAAPQGALIDAAVMAAATDPGGFGRTRMWASIGWGAAAPLAGAVVAAFGLKAAFLCFTFLVGTCLLLATLMPMEVLAAKPEAAGGGAASAGSEEGLPVVPVSDDGQEGQLGGLGNLGTSRSSEKLGKELSSHDCAEGQDGPLSVHVSGTSQQVLVAAAGAGAGSELAPASREGSRHGMPPRPGPSPWLIRSSSNAPSADKPSRRSSNVIHLSAEAGGSLLPSPQRPLLGPQAADSPRSSPPPPSLAPAAPTGPRANSSSLEIAAQAAPNRQGSKAALFAAPPAGPTGGSGGVDPDAASVWQGVKALLKDARFAAFLFLTFLMGIGNGCIGYLFLYLDELGATGTLMGLCLSFNCMAEVPTFYFSGPILERLGVERALNVAMGAYVFRLCCYLALPLMPSTWCVLPVELLQGLTFALAWSAATVHVKHTAPPHLRSTVQSIVQGSYMGIGVGLGGLVGGLLYGSLGAGALYLIAAITLASGWAGAAIVMHFFGDSGSGSGGHGDGGGGSQLGSQEGGVVRQAKSKGQYVRLEMSTSSTDGAEVGAGPGQHV